MKSQKLKVLCSVFVIVSLSAGMFMSRNTLFKVDAASVSGQLVKSEQGKLVYEKFANTGETKKDNIVPDYSYCGYHNGGVSLPKVKTVKTIDSKSGDCKKLIQDAIDEVSKMPLKDGFRGAILLKPGKYSISGPLYVKTSGIVIRGSGQNTSGNGGTELYASDSSQHDLITFKGELKKTIGKKYTIKSDVPSGTREITTEKNSGVKKGDTILVVFTPNDDWIKATKTATYGWTASQYKTEYERKVTAVNGNTITIDIPVVQAITSKYGGGYIASYSESGRIEECGVEDIYMTSHYDNKDDEKHGWNAIVFDQANNCWVNGVTAKNFGYSCVTINTGNRITVQNSAMLDPMSQTTGGRKYSFSIAKGSFNLFMRCYTRGGRHDYVTGSHVAGPNAFIDSVAQVATADVGPHHRYATGLLFDNINCTQIRVRDRGTSGSGHGWSGAQTMFWNVNANDDQIHVDSPKGAMNWCIGGISGKKVGEGYYYNYGKNVALRSLYLAQLKERLGTNAIKSISTKEQEDGTIINTLKKWKGNGKLNVTSLSASSSNNNAAKTTIKPTTKATTKSTIKPTAKPTIKPTTKPTLTPDTNSTNLADGTYSIKNNETAYVLDINKESKKDGAIVIQWTYKSSANQHFKIQRRCNGYYSIISVNSNKALEVENSSTENGARIIQRTYSGTDNQLWTITNIGNGLYKIKNKASGKIIDYGNNTGGNGGVIKSWQDNDSADQKWLFCPLSN